MMADLVRAAHVGMTHAEPVTVDADTALSIAEKWAAHAYEMGMRYEEFDLDDDHVVVVVYDAQGSVGIWLWVEYEPIPCTKR